MLSLSVLVSILVIVCPIQGIELTFELTDSAKLCFYELVEQNITTTIEFQVVSGGQHDVDVTLQAPNRKVIFRQLRKQYTNHVFTPLTTGIYALCFSNEFSTFSHKLIYMRYQVGPEKELPGYLEHLNTMHSMQLATEELHAKLNEVALQQTRYRLREAQGRKRAEEINDRVMWWSMVETIVIVMVVLGEVWVLRNFFPDDKINAVNVI